MKKKIALLMAVVMLFGMTVAGTLAWLQAKSNPVVNTFTVGKIEIDLNETDVDNDSSTKANTYKVVPGNKYVKDPVVTVKAGSEPCYVFVEIVEEGNTFDTDDKYIQFEINTDDWTLVTGETNVYYYKNVVDASTANVVMTSTVLKTVNGNNITINPAITESDMTAATAAKITFNAYAVQSANLDNANAAWTASGF